VPETMLAKLIEHNNWANLQMIEMCLSLTDEQLDATPLPTSAWSIRHTLTHLVEAQQGYLSLLTLPPEMRQRTSLSLGELRGSAERSGEGLLTLVYDETSRHLDTRLQTTDGYLVEPWVVIVQVINRATEHRRQLSRMLRILGIMPPDLDGWSFGEVTNALVPHPL
jgi:uncharacterized damage-inducible protein DinB